MTKVTNKISGALCMFVLALFVASAQAQTKASAPENATQPEHLANALYLQLSQVGLDKGRVYDIRDASLERAAIHISLDDGNIGFTQDVAGKITGAFFEGDGEILLMPPDQAERGSMALFTGAAILEEKFSTAYFRFNDDTFHQLSPYMLPAANAAATDFVTQWDSASENLASMDALRLFMTFSQFLPPSAAPTAVLKDDRFFHARLEGRTHGTFDVYYDSTAPEQIWAGQSKTADNATYYDMWTSFPLRETGTHPEKVDDLNGKIGGTGPIYISGYKISSQIKPPEISSDAVLQLQARQGGERALLFELSRFLKVQRVECDGQEVEFLHNPSMEGTQLARRGNDQIVVVLSEPLRRGQKFTLHFIYGGEVLSKAGDGLLYVGHRGTWYPNLGLSYANFDLQFRYPQLWTLIATGQKMAPGAGTPPAGEGEQSSRWVSERPIPVAGFNLGEYKEAEIHAGKVDVEAYATRSVEKTFPKASELPTSSPIQGVARQPDPISLNVPPPPSPAKNVQDVADNSARAIEFYERRFGPFPYQSLRLTQLPGNMSQGWPGLIFLSTYSFLSNEERSRLQLTPLQQTLSNAVIAHETAHQWWGDLVGWDSYRDQWMIEALANYSSMMLLESENQQQFDAAMNSYRDELLLKQKNGKLLMDAGPVTLGVRLSSSEFPNGYNAISYGRGTWLLHMLRGILNDKPGSRNLAPATPDSPFTRALLKLRDQYAGKPLTTREMLHVFEEEMPRSSWYEGRKSLDWFYEGWVNGTAIPRLDLQDVKLGRARNKTMVSGMIVQKEAPDTLVTSVPIYAVLGRNHDMVLLGRVFADGPQSSFHFIAPVGTRKVVLDPYNTVLSRH